MKKHEFTKHVEQMIDPMDIGTIGFMQAYTKLIPIKLQNKLISGGGSNAPHMGFVVEPYSFFLCYELQDLKQAQALLPDHYTLIKTKIFQSDEAKYYGIFGCFNVHTSAFWGVRMEFYIIAENKDTGLLSWVIIDYHTNTVSYDEKHGLIAGNTSTCVLTTNFEGEVLVDIQGALDQRQLVVNATLEHAKEQLLDQRLWLEGNLSVAYGRDLSNNKGQAFAVTFDSKEVEKANNIPLQDVNIECNSWYPSLFKDKPDTVVCFPFAQHFLADSPGHFSEIKNPEELAIKFNTLDFKQMPKYSSKSLKTMFLIGQIVSISIITLLLVAYIIK